MKRRLWAVLPLGCMVVALNAPSYAGDCTEKLRNLKAWTLDYREMGGLKGIDRYLSLTQAAELFVGNHQANEEFASNVASHASPELMGRIGEFLKVARETPPPSRDPIADALYRTLSVTSVGGQCELEVSDDVSRLLTDTMDTVLRQALLGTWRQSGWKLCRPVPGLTADDYDAPIERLLFQEDGRYTVTWQGGGARAYGGSGKPHEDVPDYSGRYELAPEHGYIQMRFVGGIHPPRDFSGDGHYRMNGDELVLQNIWLGTYSAKKKPDTCEVTFKRSSKPPTDDTISDAALLEYAAQPYDPRKMMFKHVVLGINHGVQVVADFHCGDVCPDYTVRVIHYLVALPSCSSVGGVEKALSLAYGPGLRSAHFCFPKILADNLN